MEISLGLPEEFNSLWEDVVEDITGQTFFTLDWSTVTLEQLEKMLEEFNLRGVEYIKSVLDK